MLCRIKNGTERYDGMLLRTKIEMCLAAEMVIILFIRIYFS